MAGYTRQSAAQIVNGEIVSAPPLNAEFNQVLAAFNASTGHRHDGTANEGPLIALIADPSRHNEVLINTSLNQIDFKIAVSSVSVTQFSISRNFFVRDLAALTRCRSFFLKNL